MGATVATAMGGNLLANGGGSVVLVSAINVLTAAAGQIPGFAFLTLSYAPSAPEPGTLLGLAAGALALVSIGRRRRV
jgi:hypothetical protein